MSVDSTLHCSVQPCITVPLCTQWEATPTDAYYACIVQCDIVCIFKVSNGDSLTS